MLQGQFDLCCILCFSGILELPLLPFHCEKNSNFFFLVCIHIPHCRGFSTMILRDLEPDNFLLQDVQ